MFNIEQYLKKFSKNVNLIELNIKSVVEIINKNTNLKLLPEDIEIKDYKVFVKTSQVGKNQIFLFKNKILEEIKSSIGEKIVDIK